MLALMAEHMTKMLALLSDGGEESLLGQFTGGQNRLCWRATDGGHIGHEDTSASNDAATPTFTLNLSLSLYLSQRP